MRAVCIQLVSPMTNNGRIKIPIPGPKISRRVSLLSQLRFEEWGRREFFLLNGSYIGRSLDINGQ
jgi:hypothetical protein